MNVPGLAPAWQGEGVTEYNLTGNALPHPMSTRDQELRRGNMCYEFKSLPQDERNTAEEQYKRIMSSSSRPRIEDVIPLAQQVKITDPQRLWELYDNISMEWGHKKSAQLMQNAIRTVQAAFHTIAVDWNKLMNDPKWREKMKDRMEQAENAPEDKPSRSKGQEFFKPKKKREDMTLEEVAEEDAKQLQKEMQKAQIYQGKLHLNETQASPIAKMMEAVLTSPIDTSYAKKAKQIVESIIKGDETRPGWKRTMPDGKLVFVISQAQVALVNTFFLHLKDQGEKAKDFEELEVEPTPSKSKGKWKAYK